MTVVYQITPKGKDHIGFRRRTREPDSLPPSTARRRACSTADL